MAYEIERKYLVHKEHWMAAKAKASSKKIRQGYLSFVPERTVRVRIKGDKAYLSIKGKNEGIVRQEFEYEIPVSDAEAMLLLCEGALIEKIRYSLFIDDLEWEVDEFFAANEGLILAEVELENESIEPPLPAWIDVEVSDDARYYNANLVRQPYSDFSK